MLKEGKITETTSSDRDQLFNLKNLESRVSIIVMIDKKPILVKIDKHSKKNTFLDLIMAVQEACAEKNLFAPAQYRGADGNLHEFEHLGINVQKLGLDNGIVLQTGNSVFFEKTRQDLSIENIRRRMIDIIFGSSAKEIAQYNSLSKSSHTFVSRTPKTNALLALCNRYHLLSRTQIQSIIAHIQSSQVGKEFFEKRKRKHGVLKKLNQIAKNPRKKPVKMHPEEKVDHNDDMVFTKLTIAVLSNILIDYTEEYYKKQAERVYKLQFPKNWHQLSDEEKNALLEEYLPGESDLQKLASLLSEIKIKPKKFLEAAALERDKILFELALKCGASVGYRNEPDEDSLMWACTRNYFLMVERLLMENVLLMNVDLLGEVLHAASNAGHPEIVELLLEQKNCKVNYIHPFNGYTALIAACAQSRTHPEVVVKLLQHGADINHKDKTGETPLSWACMSGKFNIVKILLQNGADVRVPCVKLGGKDILTVARQNGDIEIANLIGQRLKKEAEEKTLKNIHLEMCSLAPNMFGLNLLSPFTLESKYWMTIAKIEPPHTLSYRSSHNHNKNPLKKDSNKRIEGTWTSPSFSGQIFQGIMKTADKKSELVKLYELKNASQAELERGLRKIVLNKMADSIKNYIKEAKVNVNAQDPNPKSKKTALHWAVEVNDLDCVRILLENGAKNSIPDASGRKPSDYPNISPEILSLLNPKTSSLMSGK